MKVGFIGGKFLPFHTGHEKAILMASEQVEKLYVVLSSSVVRDKELCEKSKIKYMSAEVRMAWLGETFADYPNIFVVNVVDNDNDTDYDWDKGADLIKEAIPEPINAVFSSEREYEVHFNKNFPDAKHIVLDADRVNIPISATMIRGNVYRYWNFLPEAVRAFFAIKVAVVGTESTGKTTLCKKLSRIYDSPWVPEVGRAYTERSKNLIIAEKFDDIAMQQFLDNEGARKYANPFVFIDSEAVVTQYYLKEYCGEYSDMVEAVINRQNIDHYIYLEPDIPWVADGFRFLGNPEVRRANNVILKKMFEERKMKVEVIGGSFEERQEKVCDFLNKLF